MNATIQALKELMLDIGIERTTVDSLDPAAPLAAQGLDSIDYPAFSVALEKRYQLTISDSDSLTLKSLNDFIAFLERSR